MVSLAAEAVAYPTAVNRPAELARARKYSIGTVRSCGIDTYAYLLDHRLLGYLAAYGLSRVLLAVNVGYFHMAGLFASPAHYKSVSHANVKGTGLYLHGLIVEEGNGVHFADVLYGKIALGLDDVDYHALAALLDYALIQLLQLVEVHVVLHGDGNSSIALLRYIYRLLLL